jgi:putative effector of murein hydrolase
MSNAPIIASVLVHPVFGLALTVAVYAMADSVSAALGRPPLLNPVLTSVVIVASFIVVSGMGYVRYFAQAAPLHHALGLMVVLFAVPLARQSGLIRAAGLPLAAALLIGSITALATALTLPLVMGASTTVVASLAPKSVTAALAIGIADRLGGLPGLTAVVTISTGIFGAVAGPPLLGVAGVRDERAIGFALGLASHGLGTARALQISERAGAFASVGMILNALFTGALAPVMLGIVAR